ncbi:MAG: type VII toxin-antitoxin system HepT family RNase toxin [Anaerolineae bacterium]
MVLNLNLIQQRFDDIQASVERLEAIAKMDREAFLADQDMLDIASYRLLVAIEAAIQLCFHVSAHRAHRAPETYAECFGILAEAGILPADLSRNLQQMARFRNMLVHIYWDVEYERIYAMLQENLDDLRAFVGAIRELL